MSAKGPALPLDLARRLQLALTAGHEQLFQLVLDPAEEVLKTLLKNPALAEEHLLALLRRRDLSEELLRTIYAQDSVRSSHRLKLALAQNPQAPGQLVLALLPHLYLFELFNFCILPGTTPDQRYAAERQIILRLPTVELGNKLTLARRAGGAILDALLAEGQPQIVQAALDNPRLKEASILKFLRTGRASADTISQVARHPRWAQRHQLRLAILRHRRTPAVWFSVFLPQLSSPELKALLASRNLVPAQRDQVVGELRKRGWRTG